MSGIDPQRLHVFLTYDPKNGKLFWKERDVSLFSDGKNTAAQKMAKWNGKHANREAFTADNGSGYRGGSLMGKTPRAHRVIWAMQTGRWPTVYIDHINGDRADNRWCNLREADASENSRNAKLRSDNKSGLRGVTLFRGKWRAEICLYGKSTYLGAFASPEQAAAAYAEASRRLHGEFGRVA
jgi:hypothetical protein